MHDPFDLGVSAGTNPVLIHLQKPSEIHTLQNAFNWYYPPIRSNDCREVTIRV